MSQLVLIAFAVVATSLVSSMTIYKRELPIEIEGDHFRALNDIEDFEHYAHFKVPIPPAYSTVSYVQTHHDKPVSYSGFTNHGRGHHDPGYAIEFRSEGFSHHDHDLHHHHSYDDHEYY